MKSTRMLEKDAASLWDQDKLPAFAIFKAEQGKNKINFYPDTFPDRCTQQAASNSSVNRRMSQGAQNKRKRQPFLFFLTVLLHLVCAKRAALSSCSHWQEPGLGLFILPIAEGGAGAGGRWTEVQRAKSAGGRRDSSSADFYTATRGSVVLTLISH